MKLMLNLMLGLVLTATLTACASSPTASRFAMPDDTLAGLSTPDVRVESFTVTVPSSLGVNERNLYYPIGDIVWRGEPRGDRRDQVKAIFETSLRKAAPQVQGGRPARLDVQVTRFHAVSEKARYSVGGIHDIHFKYRLIDLETGVQIGATEDVVTELRALAGQAAIEAEARGATQKARIVDHLTQVFLQELVVPGVGRAMPQSLAQY